MARRRDELFEAVAAACGWDWRDVTKSSRGRLNAALVELREVEATPEQVIAAARIYRSLYEGATLTPQALTGNWPELMRHYRGFTSPRYDPAESFAAALEKADLSDDDEPQHALPAGPVGDEIKRVADRMGSIEE